MALECRLRDGGEGQKSSLVEAGSSKDEGRVHEGRVDRDPSVPPQQLCRKWEGGGGREIRRRGGKEENRQSWE